MAERSEQEITRESIDQWVQELSRELEIEGVPIDVDAVLRLAGVAAHTVVRPAAPVTTFLIGYVTGLAEASGQADFERASRAATRVAERLLEGRGGAGD
ncbi:MULTISPECIES: DUF6457 domain-containing protein [Actinomycetes]|uniref:DUF6457 domain-containing protein n=2 Tax=Actinomycetes TaxID=1760 RepID=A0ABP6LTK2_9MICC|nr:MULTISPECIES: DUF6457 domain-containing protein [unclassified Nesterenkonia]MDS2172322.1 DUF6457 domain-containing protein [Nesterenkonia sp. CL21]OSM43586.1 hypothetical protein BCY76_007635 [Nesterenkonia sp. PF2B19]